MNINLDNLVILDTETTGLKNTEICEICILDCEGNRLLDTLVKPVNIIPAEVINIHGITNEMVADVANFAAMYDKILECLKNKTVAIYNSRFDIGALVSSAKWCALDHTPFEQLNTICVMHEYAFFYGEPLKKKRGFGEANFYRNHKLGVACEQQQIKLDVAMHRAYADCLMTLALIKNSQYKYSNI